MGGAPRGGLIIAGLALLGVALGACPEREAPEPTLPAEDPTATAGEAGALEAGELGADLGPERRALLLATLRELARRPACNRIMGCQPLVTLAQMGRDVVPALNRVVADNPRADGYWFFQIIALLGQLDDDRALPTLHGLLDDARWEVPIRAAQALGRLARPASVEPLRAALARGERRDDPALVAVTLGALSRVEPARAREHRDALAALIPHEPAHIAEIPSVILDILIEVVREVRLPQALPAVRVAALDDNRFVRAQALDTLARLQDTGGIPYALDRLDDELPSIRKKAMAALQAITGIHTMDDAAQWRAWCERNGVAALPGRENAPRPPSGEQPR